jgi:hypothetical protein
MLTASIHGFTERYPGDDNAEEGDETCGLPRLYWFSFT